MTNSPAPGTTEITAELLERLRNWPSDFGGGDTANRAANCIERLIAELQKAKTTPPASSSPAGVGEGWLPARDDRQRGVLALVHEAFGEDAAMVGERVLRVLEEAIELAQAEEIPRERVDALTTHVYSRVPGDPADEVGAVGLTLLAYCEARGFSADQLEAREIARVRSLPLDRLRARRKEKLDAGVLLAAAPSLPVPAQDAGVEAILGQVAGIRLWRDAYPDGPDVLDGTAYVSPDNVRRAREAISRHAPAPGQAGEDIELVPGMPEYWRDAIGGSYAPQVWGKYQALYPTSVAQAMRLAGQRAPECADVIAALVWQLGIVDVRDRHLSELVLELQGQAATPPNASAVKELEATARPSDADLHAFGASEAACIKWPNDTPEHKALRAAYTEGAAESRPSDDSV